MNTQDYEKSLYYQKYYDNMELRARMFVHIPAFNVKKVKNIKYGEDKRQRYDLIYQDNKNKKPLFIYVHGGGFLSGVLTLRRPFCDKIAKEKDYFVLNVDYRVGPQCLFNEQINDIFKVIEIMLDNAEKYNIDTSKIIVGGESAGGYYSNLIGCISKHHELYEKFNIDFKYKDTFDVKSTLLINGVYTMSEMVKTKEDPAAPYYAKCLFDLTDEQIENIDNVDTTYMDSCGFVDENYPPSVVIRGEHDIYDKGSIELINIFKERNVEFIEYFARGISGNHGWTIAPINKEGKKCFKVTFDKIDEYINK